MELNEQNKQHLYELLANPTMASPEDITFLSQLVEAYPSFQPLHLLNYEASKKEANAAEYLTKASLHNGGDLCFRLMYAPETLVSKYDEPFDAERVIQDDAQEVIIEDEVVFEEIEDLAPSVSLHMPDIEAVAELVEEGTADSKNTEESTEKITTEEKTFEEEEVFEEIEDVALGAKAPMIGSDFDDITSVSKAQTAPEDHRVSKYDDDQLPYTFLWWLAKTRKEHEQIFQPYVTQKKAEKSTGALQHQIVEHIFHLQTPFDLEEELPTVKPEGIALTKKDQIIDNFIKNDPQIKAPKAEQINTENKAKKSAEDEDDLVSETLATIYIEQMLYHKAIETYEKLSLKFPEKSRYFADLIQSLEKKI